MGTLIQDTKYIYESPDGGHTVYARLPGSTERNLIGISLTKQKFLEDAKQKDIWIDILKESENNPALQKAIENVMLLYKISKN
jgi:hypothetical protein